MTVELTRQLHRMCSESGPLSVYSSRWWLNLAMVAAAFMLVLLAGCQSVPTELHCAVNSVHDGDTLRVTCGGQRMKIRLYCIDAPEIRQRPWGKESRDYLRSIAPLRVLVIAKNKDRYGRTVGEVLTADSDRRNLNLAMVQAGMAVVYERYCDESRYHRAEKAARERRAGVWSKSGLQQRPWVTRHRK